MIAANMTFEQEKKAHLDSMELGEAVYEILDFLLQDQCDIRIFDKKYWNGGCRPIQAVAAYRKYRQEVNQFPYDVFRVTFSIRPILALETMFQHKVYEEDLKLLNERIENNTINLKMLYEKHRANPTFQMLAHIL